MSTFKNIEKLGLSVHSVSGLTVVSADSLEMVLQSAQVVYGTNEYRPDEYEWSKNKLSTDTHSALLIGITPIKKQTKAEAALEFMQMFVEQKTTWHSQAAWEEAKRILEMKDEV